MAQCPCRVLETTPKKYEECCEPLHSGKSEASAPENLMRARYSAYVKKAISYIGKTQILEKAETFDEAEALKWAESAEWKGLKIIDTKKGAAADTTGIVEFEAHYQDKSSGKDLIHREVSLFEKVGGKWLFKEGNIAGAQPFKRLDEKQGRNDPCACGSGKKYKKCHGA